MKPTFAEALRFWIKLGFISFGGPAGQIAIMHEYLVDRKKWISASKFLHALNYCMILPGPEAQQLAIYMGWLLHGRWGGLAAGILFVLPSMFILLGLSILYVSYGAVPWISAMFNGLKPAVIAVVVLALIRIGKKSILSPFHFIVAAASFVLIFFFNVPFPLLIIGSIILAAVSRQLLPALFSTRTSETASAADESGYYINRNTIIPDTGFSVTKLIKQILLATILWMAPLLAFQFMANDSAFWNRLSVFFTQAALVTFGGAYAVLPYVAQVSVEQLGWLTELQMIDGLALGETTPGPLIMVLVFVGFMAGYNHFDASLTMGTLALATTTWYTFLPCFLFIFAGAPIIERTQENNRIREMLSLVTAAVVGVVLNLTVYLGSAVVFPAEVSFIGLDYIALGWIVVSFAAMYRMNIGMLSWIGISALFGLVHYLVIS